MERDSSELVPVASTNITVFHHVVNYPQRIIGPLIKQIAHLYIKEIDEDEELWDSYLTPFSWKLWVVLLLWILVASFVILLTAYAALRFMFLQEFTLFDQALTPLSAFCNQGIYKLVHGRLKLRSGR